VTDVELKRRGPANGHPRDGLLKLIMGPRDLKPDRALCRDARFWESTEWGDSRAGPACDTGLNRVRGPHVSP